MDEPRIVADTNVLISGLLWTGIPHEIIKLAEDKSVVLYSSLLIKVISEDPEDDKILECAVAAQAGYIISGDPHLLQLKKFREIDIVLPQDFINEI